jgi:hypothetical protein
MASYLPTPKSKQPKPVKAPPPPPQAPEPASVPEVKADQAEAIRPVHRKGLPDWAKGVLASLGLVALVFSGITAFAFLRNFIGSGGTSINPFVPSNGGDKTPLPAGITPTVEIPALSYKPWNGVDRVTILALGLDARLGSGKPKHRSPLGFDAGPEFGPHH